MESGKIIVVANQKGGVAKTSTVRNLSYALAEMGKKVLVVDFDPQYNLTTSFGVLPTQAPYNTGTLITNLLLDESLPDTNEFIQKIGSVDLIPSSRSLTVAEANLLMTPDSNDYLAALLSPLRLSYDYIIVDTNPSLGSLTINALTTADEVIIPIDPELFALTGLQALVDTIKKIKRKLNPSIEIGGILFTKCNKRTNLYRRTYGQVTKETRRRTRIFAAFKSCSRRLCPVNMSICGWRPEKPTILWSFTINTVPITAWSITICRTATGCMTLIWTSKSTKRLGHFGLSVMRTAALVYITRLIPTTPHTRKQSTGSTVSLPPG